MKAEFDAMKAELRDFDMAKQIRQMAELTQLVNSLKVQHAAEMADLKFAYVIQIKPLRKEENSSADRFQPQDGQTLPGTDPIQFVSHKCYTVRPLSMPKFNIQEMRGSTLSFPVG